MEAGNFFVRIEGVQCVNYTGLENGKKRDVSCVLASNVARMWVLRQIFRYFP